MISISTLEYFIVNYGYWALLMGTFLEGETILIIGGISAHFGLLELPWVMLTAFIGSFAGDQLYYFIGYFKGRELVSRHPAWEKKVDRVYDDARPLQKPDHAGIQVCLWNEDYNTFRNRNVQTHKNEPILLLECRRGSYVVHFHIIRGILLRIRP